MSTGPVAFLYGLQMTQGARARQEDQAAVWQPETLAPDVTTYPLLAVLADGMGGHVSGQVASQLACEAFIKAFSEESNDLGPRLARALDAANMAIAQNIQQQPDHNGMGCTLVGAYLDEAGLRWVSVGDSALLLLRDGQLHRLNADHSHGALLDKQASEGIISREAAESDTRRRALRSAVTGERIPIQEIHAQALELHPGDKLIVASDGLLTLSGDEIAGVAAQFDLDAPSAIADQLVASVIEKQVPRQDNTAVITVCVNESDGMPVISTPVPSAVPSEITTPTPDVAAASSEVRILGLKLRYFLAFAVVAFLIGFFAF